MPELYKDPTTAILAITSDALVTVVFVRPCEVYIEIHSELAITVLFPGLIHISDHVGPLFKTRLHNHAMCCRGYILRACLPEP